MAALHLPLASSSELVRAILHTRLLTLLTLALSYSVLHPAGNVAEHLVGSGLARIVDWHAGMLSSSGGMERLRAQEKLAKEKRLGLYANAPTPKATSAGAAPGASGPKTFDAQVIRVWSGDQISVVEKDNLGKERRLQLSSTRGPKCVSTSVRL